MPPLVFPFSPRFSYGAVPTLLDLMHTSEMWLPDREYIGGLTESGAGVPESYTFRKSGLLDMNIRVDQTEWAAFIAMLDSIIDAGSLGAFNLYPDKSKLTSYGAPWLCYLMKPQAGMKVSPQRVGTYPTVFTVPMTIKTVSGAIFDVQLTAPTFSQPFVVAVTAPVGGTTAIGPLTPVHQANDIILLFTESANENVAVPDGWTEAPGSPVGTGVAADVAATRLQVFWRRAVSDKETAPFVADPGDHVVAAMMSVRGCLQQGSPFGPNVGSDVQAGVVAAVSIPGFNTVVDKTLVVAVVAHGIDGITAQGSGWANASLANVTERIDGGSAANNGGGLVVITGDKAVAGAVAATTGVLATAFQQARLAFALRPQV